MSDIRRLEALLSGDPGDGLAMHLYRPHETIDPAPRLKLYRHGEPLTLSDVLPLLENMGTKVIDERPYEIRPAGADPVWIYDFGLHREALADLDVAEVRERFQETLAAVWRGEIENDRFNRLVLRAGLRGRDVTVLRAYVKYLRQVGTTFSRDYMAATLVGNPDVASRLVELFAIRFDPDFDRHADRGLLAKQAVAEIEGRIDLVESLNEDRVLRSLLRLVTATLRTNFFQTPAEGRVAPRLALKLDPRSIPDLPLPRPMFEIFVYSPRVEGVHLRGGPVARGGLRWSDRPEDFRTEILGLAKAQTVKNAVIVPVGAKGGFVVKSPPPGRDALQAEVASCYRTFVRGLLDVTDNLIDGRVVPPHRVVRHDGDDPYLVVAADKGTATFSDMANGISREYAFWLGDAFASGGSKGYDHKAMGITARGAWVSVRRHFRALGVDVQNEDFTVAGIGDMSGDVFGNGMLLSRHIRLVAAFDHRHVFLDPDPDPARSFDERARLFALPRSSWADYDPALISPGGGVFPRTAKAVPLSDEMRRALDVDAEALPPDELIRAILRAPVDLLWNGGVGTYVKASTEANTDVGDKNNDAVRIDATELRCRVVGEGGNLGFTQRGRIEFALNGGSHQHRRDRQRGRGELLRQRGQHQDPARPGRARRRPHRQATGRAARRDDRRRRGPGAGRQRRPDPCALHRRRAGRRDARRPRPLPRRAGALRQARPRARAAAHRRRAPGSGQDGRWAHDAGVRGRPRLQQDRAVRRAARLRRAGGPVPPPGARALLPRGAAQPLRGPDPRAPAAARDHRDARHEQRRRPGRHHLHLPPDRGDRNGGARRRAGAHGGSGDLRVACAVGTDRGARRRRRHRHPDHPPPRGAPAGRAGDPMAAAQPHPTAGHRRDHRVLPARRARARAPDPQAGHRESAKDAANAPSTATSAAVCRTIWRGRS